MAKVSYVHVEDTGTFGFHVANGELVEVGHDAPFVTDDPGLIAYLDTVPFVKRAGEPDPDPQVEVEVEVEVGLDPDGGEEA